MANTNNELRMLNALVPGRKVSAIGNDQHTGRTFIFLDDRTFLWVAYTPEQGAYLEYEIRGEIQKGGK